MDVHVLGAAERNLTLQPRGAPSAVDVMPAGPAQETRPMHAIKTEISDPDTVMFEFAQPKTMYGGKRTAPGDTIVGLSKEAAAFLHRHFQP